MNAQQLRFCGESPRPEIGAVAEHSEQACHALSFVDPLCRFNSPYERAVLARYFRASKGATS
jgi:hypothetical protein